jgi:hypothetical protein
VIRSLRIQRELAAVARKYPGSQPLEDGAGVLVVVPAYPIPSGFTPSPVRLAVKIGALYPTEKLDLFWVDTELKRIGGAALPNVMNSNIQLAGQPWIQISWHDNAPHDPERISVLGYLQGVRQWFAAQVQAA